MKSKTVGKYILVFITCVIVLFPVYWMFVTSVTPTRQLLVPNPALIPDIMSLDFSSYARAIADRPIIRWFTNSGIITIGTTLIAIAISIMGGYSLSRFKSRGITLTGYALLVSRMLPSTLLIIPLYTIFSRTQLLNHPLSVVIANTTYIVPFGVWMMKGFFDGIPRDLEEAAQVDGCTIVGSVVRVVFPLTLPGISATAMYAAILSWSEFLFAATFLSSQRNWTITVGIYSFIGEHLTAWNELMAAALISVVPIVIIFGFLEKHLVRGLTAGAINF